MAHTITRRTLLKAAIRTGTVASIAPVLGAYSYYGEPHWLALEHITLPVRGLPPQVAQLKIAHLTDFHVSHVTSPAHVAQAVELTNAQRPDLIVLTGDFVTAGTSYMTRAAATLASLRAPLGVYAVLGNHDHWSNADRMQAALEAQGIPVLRNAHRRLDIGGGSVWLVGVDDIWEQKDNLPQALAGVPADGLRLLLAHEPDFADTAAQHGITLQLSGHSHGGQVCLPFFGPLHVPYLSTRYPIGLRRVAGSNMFVYTNRGIGMVEPAVRFNCRPEVALVTLTNSPSA